MKDYAFPDERRINIILLIYAVLEEVTVDEAFNFLQYNQKVAEGGRKKPFTNSEIVRLHNDLDLTFTEIAKIYGVAVSTITRRYKKEVKNER
jgi:DNA-directed RNA polymerase specialized sigma24 family protein